MTWTVAILALAASTPPPLGMVVAAERLPLPLQPGAVTLRNRPFEKRLTLEVPPASVGAVALRLRGASRFCPKVEAETGAVTLVCTTPRLRATLEQTPEPTLDLRALTVLPWRPEEEGAPIVPLDTARLGLGPCPGSTPTARGECLLAERDIEGAREQFELAVAGKLAALAELRLGDLALLVDDDPESASAHWRRARAQSPYGRLAQARLCELDDHCLRGRELHAVYDLNQVAPPVRADMVIRAARLKALDGDLLGAARDLAADSGPGGACAGVEAWCRHLLLIALQQPGPVGAEAVTIYLDWPRRTEGPLAMTLAEAAARQAETTGAPVFAANLLASLTGRVAEAELGPYLQRVALLFLAGNDRARADEILRYAATHLAREAWRADGWERIQKAVRRPPAPPAAPAPDPDPDVVAARSAAEAARLITLSQGGRP